MKTIICLIRHGETPWNTGKRIQGHTDIGLNDTGLEQALAAGRWLKTHAPEIRSIYSSDLNRAWLTATLIGEALGVHPVPESRLRERRYGHFEGLTYQEAQQRFPEEYGAFESRIPEFALPGGGESLNDLFDRITGCLQGIAGDHAGQTIAMVCHGGVLDIVNRFVRNKALHEKRDFEVPNAGLNWVQYEPGGNPAWQVRDWGNTRHLSNDALDELPG